MEYVHGVQGGEPWKPASARGEWLKGHRSTWPTGGRGKGLSLSPLNSHPSQTNPLVGVWGQRERRREASVGS